MRQLHRGCDVYQWIQLFWEPDQKFSYKRELLACCLVSCSLFLRVVQFQAGGRADTCCSGVFWVLWATKLWIELNCLCWMELIHRGHSSDKRGRARSELRYLILYTFTLNILHTLDTYWVWNFSTWPFSCCVVDFERVLPPAGQKLHAEQSYLQSI